MPRQFALALLPVVFAAAPGAADAGLRADASILGQRSADLDDRVDAARRWIRRSTTAACRRSTPRAS